MDEGTRSLLAGCNPCPQDRPDDPDLVTLDEVANEWDMSNNETIDYIHIVGIKPCRWFGSSSTTRTALYSAREIAAKLGGEQ